ncbi:hypothetical protein B566_EDAN000655, partial [Ephemera danica]
MKRCKFSSPEMRTRPAASCNLVLLLLLAATTVLFGLLEVRAVAWQENIRPKMYV